jgi:hypothetical protein
MRLTPIGKVIAGIVAIYFIFVVIVLLGSPCP